MEKAIIDACEALRDRLERMDSAERSRAYAIRKGRTLYLVSDEARELRRLDAIYAESR
jgi:hypothetical protein